MQKKNRIPMKNIPNHKTKLQFAYEKIKEGIITDRYQPNQFLSARELCEELNISRTPVMEALRRLAYEGFVEHIPDKGMFVAQIRFNDLIEIFELRQGLEGAAARLCTLRKTESIVQELRNCLMEYEQAFREERFNDMVDLDTGFHMIFVKGACNSRMENYHQILLEQTKRGVFLSATNPERIQQVIIPTHRRILDAILEGNPEEAERLVKNHYDEVLKFFVSYQINKGYYNVQI